MINVLICGDFSPRERIASMVGKKDYSFFNQIKDITSKQDYSIINFECPALKQPNNYAPIEKCGPNLQTDINGVDAVKYAGFDCCTLANNHVLDFSENGLKDTMEFLKQRNLDFIGAGDNIEKAGEILYKSLNGKTLAVINCCEHEFSIAGIETAGANPLNPVSQFYQITQARQNADYVLVIVHGGHEHWQLPSPRMQQTYRFFIDCGADAVVNHHQHCYSGYEYYKDKPIFYGLGNLCFDEQEHKNDIWNYGYSVQLSFDGKITHKIYPHRQCSEKPLVELLNEDSFDGKLSQLNSIIADKDLLQKETDKNYSQIEYVKRIFDVFDNRFYGRTSKILPVWIPKWKKVRAENYVCCESHRDRLIYFLQHRNKK